jgi:hypothetical protein
MKLNYLVLSAFFGLAAAAMAMGETRASASQPAKPSICSQYSSDYAATTATCERFKATHVRADLISDCVSGAEGIASMIEHNDCR